jgi:hypothetical protein
VLLGVIVSRKISEIFKNCGFVNINYLYRNKIVAQPSKILNIINRDWRRWIKPDVMRDPTFGYTDIGPWTITYMGSGRHEAFVYNLPEDGQATSITAYIAKQTNGTPVSGKAAIYNIVGGHPYQRVALSQENTSVTGTWQWYDFPISPGVDLTAGDYGLLVKLTDTWQFKYYSGTTGQRHYNSDFHPGDPLEVWPGCTGHFDHKMSIYCTYITLAPPAYYTLTVNSTPITGVTFIINGAEKTTPYTETLTQGTYTISMPKEVIVEGQIYYFSQWEDGSTSPERTINLNSDLTLTATYKLLLKHILTVDSTPIKGIPFTIEKVS